MERLNELGYVKTDQREFRLSFKPPRDIVHPDLLVASTQIARGDRQMLDEAKKWENENRRVWFFVIIPCDKDATKGNKGVVKIDLLIATPQGAMVIKVLDWSGPCKTSPGDKWVETKIDGSKVEHDNQLVELDKTTQWLRLFLEKKGLCPPVISSYVLFASPHAKPTFTLDPRIVVGPEDCSALVKGNGRQNEVAVSKGLADWSQQVLKSTFQKVKELKSPANPDDSKSSIPNFWQQFQLLFDSLPQFDLILLRKPGCIIFGRVDKFEIDPTSAVNDKAKELNLWLTRTSTRVYSIEHSASGLLGAPVALVTGGLGLQPSSRLRLTRGTASSSDVCDVSPQTKLIFRPYGCEGIAATEINDLGMIELAKVPMPTTVSNDGTDVDVFDQVSQMVGGFISKSVQAGVKQMLPFPLNSIIGMVDNK